MNWWEAIQQRTIPMKTGRRTTNSAAIWARRVQFEGELSPIAARALLKFRFCPRDHAPRDELAAMARAGAFTPQEQFDLDNYERLGCVLDILHSKARIALKTRRTASSQA